MLRIVAGTAKNQKIKVPQNSKVSPTMDRVREDVFNIIQFKIKNAIVLDLFAGSGAYGLESLSRGATKVIFCDHNSDAVTTIRFNLNKLKFNNYDLVNQNVLSFLPQKRGALFDLIFIDPPYKNHKIYWQTLQLISELKLLNKTGLIILEKENNWELIVPPQFVLQKVKNYHNKSIWLIGNNI